MAKPASATVRTFQSSVGVPENNRQAIIALLNQRLADSVDLKSQVKWAHWNVKGMHFIQVHELFDSIAGHLDDQTDSLAERATTLGGVANGTVREAAAKSGLKEADLTAIDAASMLKFLVHNVAHHANALRTAVQEADDLGDPITTDLFTTLTRELDKDLWFLEAHLQG
ncbi:MAG TPA: DNA starvation/stationary phase protection protein Dps [Candidatus Acidoferrum sp.]|jgi:starvation-inducible DNA-binding protein